MLFSVEERMLDNNDKPLPEKTIEMPKPTAPQKKTRAGSVSVDPSMEAGIAHKVSLVELIMILMLVGVVMIFIFGMRQMKIDKQKEAVAEQKFQDVVPVFQRIINAMEEYKKTDAFGDYPVTIEELGTFDTADFEFTYDSNTLIVTGTTTKEFGKEGIQVLFSLNNQVYEVNDTKPKEKPTILDDWLP
jgi:hypothetical protein